MVKIGKIVCSFSFKGNLKMEALGRVALIGDLYDIRTDKFLDISLLNSTAPQKMDSHSIDSATFSECFYDWDQAQTIFKRLEIPRETQLSILAGLIPLRGIGNIFKKFHSPNIGSRVSLPYRTKRTMSSLHLGDGDNHPFDEDLLYEIEATHVVTRVENGADYLVSVEDPNHDEREITDIQSDLKMVCEDLKSAKSQYLKSRPNYKFEIYADFIEDSFPQSIVEVAQFWKSFVEMKNITQNLRPVSYELQSLQNLKQFYKRRTLHNSSIVEVNNNMYNQIIIIFDAMNKLEQEINLYNRQISKYQNYVPTNLFENYKIWFHTNLTQFKSGFIKEFSRLLIKVRFGEEKGKLKAFLKSASIKLKKSDDYMRSDHRTLRRIISSVKSWLGSHVILFKKTDVLEEFLLEHCDKNVYICFYDIKKSNNDIPLEFDKMVEKRHSYGKNVLFAVAFFDVFKEKNQVYNSSDEISCYQKGRKASNDSFIMHIAFKSSMIDKSEQLKLIMIIILSLIILMIKYE